MALPIKIQLGRLVAALSEGGGDYTPVPTRLQAHSQGSVSPLERGHEIVRSVRRALEAIDGFMHRTVDQVKIHEMALLSLAEFIYGSAFDTHQAEILEFFGATCPSQGIIVTAPRRFGKTICLAMLNAALLYACPGIEIYCVANSEDATHALRKLTKRYLVEVFHMADTKENFPEDNATHLRLANGNTMVYQSATKGDSCTFLFCLRTVRYFIYRPQLTCTAFRAP